MARETSLILVIAAGALAAAASGAPAAWPAVEVAVAVLEVAVERLLDGDPGGALEALLAI